MKNDDGRVDLVTDLSPLETLRVAQSPAAQVVKKRRSATTVFSFFNGRKAGSPWHDVRLRQAVNYAIHREDLIRYATKGNGEIIPALLSPKALGYDPALTPYPFDPEQARHLLRDAGYPDGLPVTLIAPEDLTVQPRWSVRGYPETRQPCCVSIKQHPCGNEKQDDHMERAY